MGLARCSSYFTLSGASIGLTSLTTSGPAAATPEPASLTLLGLLGYSWRRKKAVTA